MALPAAAAEPPSRYAEVDGVRVHYRSYGEGQRAVVLVHGWTCDHTFWARNVPGIVGSGRRVLAIDLPGHGLSDRPEVEYTMDLFGRSVAAVMDHAGVKRAVVAGHSMGGPVIRQFYRGYPERTVALVFVDAGFRRPSKTEAEREKIDKMLAERSAQYDAPDYRGTMTKVIQSMFVPSTTEALREEITTKMLATPKHVARSAFARMLDEENAKEDPIRVPCLVVFAARPSLPTDYEAYLRGLMTNLDYQVMDGVGHFLMMEKPERFNSVLIKFLDRAAR
jgi:pimeloyl-ACP methyl ester carboxylesterase